MKDRHFGDRNDFLKLTLIERLRRFTFIPALTADDGSSDGALTSYDGSQRPVLARFLRTCVDRKARNMRKLRELLRRNYPFAEYVPPP